MKLTVCGVVHEVASRRRLFFFRDFFLMVKMDPDDIKRMEREVNAQFPGYGSLGTMGSAVPFERLDDPSKYPVGQKVEMTVAIGNAVEEFFLAVPRLALESISPIS